MHSSYSKYTDYYRYVDFKRLDFFVHTLETSFGSFKNKVIGLDIGCGKGNITFPLASLGYHMLGIDINAEAIKAGSLRKAELFGENQDNPQFLVGDAQNLPSLRADYFDFIICSELLEHLRYPVKALDSLNYVLKKDGLLIVTVPNCYGPYSLIFDQFRNKVASKLVPRIGASEHAQYITLSVITRLINNAGFKVLKVRHSDFISFLPLLVRSDKFCYWDCKLADKLPSSLVSGWYLACQK
jgi:2-polyprenyl-3-methyl-5-hydroxy-6-metoxy-1,4-benzoquinol methylase